MAELDHLIYASRDVDQGVRYIEELTGARAVAGGPHVGRGTHNALLTFDDRTYFEIIGIDPLQSEPERPRAFGLDERDGPGLVAYAVHPDPRESLEAVAAAIETAGFAAGTIMDMSRQKPDGELLEWRLTAGGDTGVALQGALPFAIDWLGKPSPAGSLPSMGQLLNVAVRHPDTRLSTAIAALGLAEAVTVSAGEPRLVATIETAKGTVELT